MNAAQLVRALGTASKLTGCGDDQAAMVAQGEDLDLAEVLELLDSMQGRIGAEVERGLAARNRKAGKPGVEREPSTFRLGVQERREAVRAAHARGLRDPQIADELGMSEVTVRTIRRTLGLAGIPGVIGKDWATPIREAHAEGLLTSEIAERTGYTLRTVQQRLAELGLKANRLPRQK